MANPSLQIGNSNWAIKEDNLLGYSTAGTRFVPQPITMTRASAGTRVNSSGLVETVELLGSEEVTNGDFATDGTPSTNTWTLGWYSNTANVSISGGKITLTNSASESSSLAYATNGVSSNNVLITNQLYKLQYQVVANNGVTSFKYYSSAGAFIDAPIDLGVTHTIYIKNTSNQLFLFQNATTNSNISLDNVSIKESTKNNLARVDYDGTASSLLVEPQRRNLVTYSEVISNLSLLTGGAGTYTITDNYTDSPEGVQNASRVQMSIVDTNDGANYSLIALNSSMTNGVTREISFYAKSLTGLNQEVLVYWSTAKQIVTLTNDWQRFEISATSDNSGAVLIGTRGGTTQYYAGGDANLDFALWGLQVEDDGSGGGSSYATSYIPTDGSTVTRVQDQYSKTGISNLINSEEGVLFVEMAALSNDLTDRAISLSDGTLNNAVQIFYFNTSNRIRCRVYAGGVLQATISIIGYTITDSHKIAFKWGGGFMSVFVDGTIYGTAQAITSTPTALDILRFNLGQGSSIFYGKVKQLQVFKTALTDPELIALTTI